MSRTQRAASRRLPPGARVAVATPEQPRRWSWWRAALIVGVGALVYANSLSGPFIFDDEASIVENTQIRSLAPSVALSPYRESPTAGRPIVNASFAINYALGGLQPRGYHATNIAIHLLCALAVFGIVRRTLLRTGIEEPLQRRSADIAFAAALLWVAHPLNSEAVDYLTQRTESLMAMFFLLTLYAAVRAADGERPVAATAASITCCALGMACKESMVTAPIVVALYDRVFLFGSVADAMRKRWPLYLGLGATWIVIADMICSFPHVHSA